MTTVNQVNFEENNFYKVIFKQIAMSNAEAILGFPGSSSPPPPQKKLQKLKVLCIKISNKYIKNE